MVHGPLRFLMVLVFALFGASSAASSHSRVETPSRVIAVGDLHGDFEAWRNILLASGLADSEGEWTGGDAVLVQMGDIADRGPDSLKIIRDLQRLEKTAPVSGGRVIVLLGNHEAMNVIGDLRYVHPGEYAAFTDKRSKRRREATWRANREAIEAAYAALDPPLDADQAKARWFAETPLGMLEHRRAWKPGGELGLWAAQRPAIVRISGVLFAHGGLSIERSTESIDAINARIRAAMEPGEAIDRSVIEDPLGPLWYRGNLLRPAADDMRMPIEEELAQVLAHFGAQRLVVAHTPSLKGITESAGGLLIRIDTGISRYYGGPQSYLELIGTRAIAHTRDEGGEWQSRELAAASLEAAQ